jgi:hypothetical protein
VGRRKAPPRIREALFSDSTNMWTEDGVDLGRARRNCGWRRHRASSKVAPGFRRDRKRGCRRGGSRRAADRPGRRSSVTYPIVRGFHRHFPNLTILHFDAHPDLNDEFQVAASRTPASSRESWKKNLHAGWCRSASAP